MPGRTHPPESNGPRDPSVPWFCVKSYETPDGGEALVEFYVHFRFLYFFVCATPVRHRINGGEIEVIHRAFSPSAWFPYCTKEDRDAMYRDRIWITTSGIGWFRLEEA